MKARLPDYLTIGEEALGRDKPVQIRVVADMGAVAQDLAADLLGVIQRVRKARGKPTLIVPVGPVDHYPILAQMINDRKIDCRDTMFINMDEYLTDDDTWVPAEHPLSFRGYMQRCFYGRLDPQLRPRPKNQVFPDPRKPDAIGKIIEARGGVDACYGGIGINGHLAFNEPPSLQEAMAAEAFASLPTRCLDLTRETRTINSVTVGGELSVIPKRAITIGMREILGSRRLRFYCNRPWQSAVVRRALHGPITPLCPASLLRLHPDATLILAKYVAQTPDIRLR